ncbi:hypothetical protein MNV_470036 [Candidatus Methanoperedens nitroreducens]|uniref:Uncharacterized protein n=1 Tax=Candidatus Methanoperedens nitratireducens TaxID=1392998 RepID=A0A284VR00_9EURY|nr:hypothetical protein MNV_470036 [Candidatus Methanoperedens nitroreducens]
MTMLNVSAMDRIVKRNFGYVKTLCTGLGLKSGVCDSSTCTIVNPSNLVFLSFGAN